MTLGLEFLASQQTPPTNPYMHICSRNLAQVPEISLWESYYFDILLDRYYYFSHFTVEKTEVLVVQSDCSTSGFSFLHHLPELAQTHVHWVSDAIQHLVLCHSLLLLPSIFPNIRVFSNELALCNRWPKYWSFSFSISPSNERLGLISFKIDWFDVFEVQGTLKSLLQHHSWKASILQHSTFMVQISHPYITTGKTIVLTK